MNREPFSFLRPSAPASREEILNSIQKSPGSYSRYLALNAEWRRRFLDFCQGKSTLPLIYDPIFKRIFHSDVHPDRLSRFISNMLGMKVKVVKILPNEETMIDGNSMLIMDILVQSEDGSLINVEIQKQPYAFPAERISCYSADLLMRQYARVKGEQGQNFTYQNIKKVYVIVIYEKSNGTFHRFPKQYIHYGKTVFDTSLPLDLLQEYCLIALDVFMEIPYTERKKTEQTAWLSLLVTEHLDDAERLTQDYPWLEEIYQEVAMLRQNPEEVLGMASEALRILDRNTMQYMIDQQKAEIDHQKVEIDQQKLQLSELKARIAELEAQLDDKESGGRR